MAAATLESTTFPVSAATDPRRAGRVIGVLLLAQMVAAPVANFALLAQPITTPPGFLVNAAPHALQVYVAVLLALVVGALTVGMAVAAWPGIARHSPATAFWFVLLAVLGLVAALVEGVSLRAMVALSEEFVRAGGSDPQPFEAPRVLVRALRNGTHYTQLLLSGVAWLLFYAASSRYRLVHRAVGLLGMVTSSLLIAGALIPLFGYPTVMALFAPMGLSQLALMGWLFVRGFGDEPSPGLRPTSPAGQEK
jgi:Domain of unknown function (DUF4386)